MEQVVMTAERREANGSGPARRLRENGMVPGVAYGLDNENVVIAVPRDVLEAALRTEQRLNVLLDLRIKGIKSDKQTAAIVKEIQRHPVTRVPLSVDFQWISLTETITVSVPVQIEGSAPGVDDEGGMVDQIMHEIQVECLPTNIPDHLVADITGMAINDTIHVEALAVPEGVNILVDPAETVVSIAPPIREEDLEVRVEEELLEGLEEVPLAEEELAVGEGEQVPGEEEAGGEESK